MHHVKQVYFLRAKIKLGPRIF